MLLVTRAEPQRPSGGDLYNRWLLEALRVAGIAAYRWDIGPDLAASSDTLGLKLGDLQKGSCAWASAGWWVLVDGILQTSHLEALHAWGKRWGLGVQSKVARSAVQGVEISLWLLNHVPATRLHAEGVDRLQAAEASLAPMWHAVLWTSPHARRDGLPLLPHQVAWVLPPGKIPDKPDKPGSDTALRGATDFKLQERQPNSKPQRWMLVVGGAAPHKQIGRLVEVFSQLSYDVGWGLRWVGAPNDMNALHCAGKAPAVGYRGVDRHRLWQHMQAADLVCIPSRYESFGLTALEALHVGVPVLASVGCGVDAWLRFFIDSWALPCLDTCAASGGLKAASARLQRCLEQVEEHLPRLSRHARLRGEAWPSWQEQLRKVPPLWRLRRQISA